jgi:hypothetical protein
MLAPRKQPARGRPAAVSAASGNDEDGNRATASGSDERLEKGVQLAS